MQNKNYNAQTIVEAGLTTALIVVIMLACIYIPIFSIFINFILPIPIAILYIRQDYKITIISVVASGIFIAMLVNPITALSSIVLVGLSGMTFGYCVKNKKKFGTTILMLTVAIIIGEIVYFSVYIGIISNKGIYEFVNDFFVKPFKEGMSQNKIIYSKMGISNAQLSYMESIEAQITPQYIMRIIPSMMVLASVFIAYLNYLIGSAVLKRLNYDVMDVKPFNEIYISTRVGTAVAIVLLIGVILNRRNMELGYYFMNSSKNLLQFIFMVDGLALASYYLKNKFNMSNKVIVLILILTVFYYFIYDILGFADMLIDFRKLDPYRAQKK
ncbi:uncharacterized protein YybS (DUF2232 family) [Clostridium algifaecis]|uniref:Uncharacterized protein YybS (DUF2232 family) n=1 Tax=Clostridium algifaecis TaxID=1472040 RepID=A0ABS4KVG5_9CLOT|nr:YybS family protein [Clostridium algifaecis]MBP2034012.1 uncharacterized protein YybS (DUF2232 family) [Clostridium algifaecis]